MLVRVLVLELVLVLVLVEVESLVAVSVAGDVAVSVAGDVAGLDSVLHRPQHSHKLLLYHAKPRPAADEQHIAAMPRTTIIIVELFSSPMLFSLQENFHRGFGVYTRPRPSSSCPCSFHMFFQLNVVAASASHQKQWCPARVYFQSCAPTPRRLRSHPGTVCVL